MKKLLTNITLAAATILLLGSCAKINERIDDLEGRINGLEKESIASINTQITSINSSIADLGTIRTNIQNLTATTATQAQDIKDLNNEDTEIGKKISDLKKADESINKRIDDLQKYVNDTLKAYGTKEWVEATFSTLAQYEATCDTIAKIDARIGALDSRLSQSIEDCADSLKAWVNVQLDGYYTIAQMDAKVAEMDAQIDTLRSENEAKADSLKTEIVAAKAELDTVKANIRTEYKSAIETAITELDGKLSAALEAEIIKVNNELFYLNDRISSLASYVLNLAGKVTALETMIQSVVIVPAYSDGSVKIDKDSLYIDCIISPSSVVKGLDTTDVAILVNKVKTKAYAGVDTVKIASGDLFEKDTTNGALSIRVNISDKLPESADSTITVAVNVKNGISDFTTEFSPVTVVVPPYVEIAAKYDENTVTTLKWYRQNLAITASGKKAWKGDNTSSAVKVPGTKDDVIVGDYFQWAASYDGYNVTENKKPDSLLIYTAFTNRGCGDSEDKFTLRSAGEGKTYLFNTSGIDYVGISPYYSGSDYTKYNDNDKATKSVLERTSDNDDVASIILGGTWRMPTKEEFKAMKEATYWAWDAMDKGYYVYAPASGDEGGLNGKKADKSTDVTGTYDKSDALLFFPAAGQGNGPDLDNANVNVYYWSSSLYSNNTKTSYYLYFSSGVVYVSNAISRHIGVSVRPVSE